MIIKETIDIFSTSAIVVEKIIENMLPKTLVALVSSFFFPQLVGIIVLFMLISVDTILGSWYAIQSGSFTSAGMKKTLVKIILYSLSIISVKLIDVILGNTLSFIINGIFIYLSLVELKSIFENLSRLGLPIPNDILFWLKKLPYGDYINIESITNIDLDKQSKMLEDFKPTIDNKSLLKIMSIEWNVWREFSERILQTRFETTEKFSIKSGLGLEVEVAIQAIENRWKKNHVDKELLEKYRVCRDFRLKEFTESLPPLYDIYHEGDEDALLKDIVASLTTALQELFDDMLNKRCSIGSN